MSTRTELLKALDGQPGQLLSGERLAQRLGISRAGVWKHLQSMKLAGLPLKGTLRQGYRLQAPFDSSLASFKSRSAKPHYFLSTSSTQTLARGGAASGLPEGHLWIAETQVKGRGRLDRKWESNYGGLWFSLLLRPKVPAAGVPPLTLLAGLALRDAVERVTGVSAGLKWPNDLVISSQKLAGILTEMSGQIDRTDWVIIGVGLNVNNSLPRALAHQAASLYRLTGQSWARAEILTSFLDAFQKGYRRYLQDGFEPFRRTYWANYYARDRMTHLKTASGPISGIARGVDASGAIMIESDTHRSDARRVASRRKIHLISEGEIVT